MKIPYTPNAQFTYNGTIYRIKTVTANALEIASHSEQSLWVAIAELENLLGIQGKAGLFQWHIAQRKTAHD